MADDDLLVTISGPALSLLLYENRRIHDQIGFLLGEIVKYVTKKITDSDRDIECIKHHINIKYIEPYPISKPFFNTIGCIDKEILENFLKDNIKKIVGWFHYRQGDLIAPTFRDRNLHSELSTYFSNANKHFQTKENFIFCILNSSKSDIGGTHKFKHLLLRCKDNQSRKYIPVPLKINNLGADAATLDGSDYKPTPIHSSCETDAFDSIYDSVRNELLQKKSDFDSLVLIQKAAEQRLEELILEVTKYDQILSELEIELNQLRQKYFEEQFKKFSAANMNEMLMKTKSSNISDLKPSTSELFNLSKSYEAVTSSETSQSQVSMMNSSEPQETSYEHKIFDRELRVRESDESLELSQIFKEQKQQTEQVNTSTTIASKLSTNVKLHEQSPDHECKEQ